GHTFATSQPAKFVV
ncbi:hypothetical protein, partial [Staphylococcus aureus]